MSEEAVIVDATEVPLSFFLFYHLQDWIMRPRKRLLSNEGGLIACALRLE